jgi:gamma-glutamylcyclotransferase
MYYFAYGSNMLTRRLNAFERGPSARAIAVGSLLGRQLRFHKVGLDASGKCDIAVSDAATDRVYGVLFEIDAAEKLALDRLECAGGGYRSIPVSVQIESEAVTAETYVAQRISAELKPFHWYKALVVAGAIEHDLPADYIGALRAVAAIEDPDEARRHRNLALLEPSQTESSRNYRHPNGNRSRRA